MGKVDEFVVEALHIAFEHFVGTGARFAVRPGAAGIAIDIIAADGGAGKTGGQRYKTDEHTIALQKVKRWRWQPTRHKTSHKAERKNDEADETEAPPQIVFTVNFGDIAIDFHRFQATSARVFAFNSVDLAMPT